MGVEEENAGDPRSETSSPTVTTDVTNINEGGLEDGKCVNNSPSKASESANVPSDDDNEGNDKDKETINSDDSVGNVNCRNGFDVASTTRNTISLFERRQENDEKQSEYRNDDDKDDDGDKNSGDNASSTGISINPTPRDGPSTGLTDSESESEEESMTTPKGCGISGTTDLKIPLPTRIAAPQYRVISLRCWIIYQMLKNLIV